VSCDSTNLSADTPCLRDMDSLLQCLLHTELIFTVGVRSGQNTEIDIKYHQNVIISVIHCNISIIPSHVNVWQRCAHIQTDKQTNRQTDRRKQHRYHST